MMDCVVNGWLFIFVVLLKSSVLIAGPVRCHCTWHWEGSTSQNPFYPETEGTREKNPRHQENHWEISKRLRGKSGSVYKVKYILDRRSLKTLQENRYVYFLAHPLKGDTFWCWDEMQVVSVSRLVGHQSFWPIKRKQWQFTCCQSLVAICMWQTRERIAYWLLL